MRFKVKSAGIGRSTAAPRKIASKTG
jgi:hypothetical protein